MTKIKLTPDGKRFGVKDHDTLDLGNIVQIDRQGIKVSRESNLRTTAFNGVEIFYRVVSVPIDMQIKAIYKSDYEKVKEFMTEADKQEFWIIKEEDFTFVHSSDCISITAYENLKLLKGLGT